MWYTLLADVVVAVHLGIVAFVILGQLATLVGVVLRWAWVRNCWFRLSHLATICIVAAEALLDITCPFTLWEDQLRKLAGQPVTEGTFIGRLSHDLLFYSGPEWVFTVCYVTFAALVLLTFVLAPPRLRRKSTFAANQVSPPESRSLRRLTCS
jgi:hypothetical protein